MVPNRHEPSLEPIMIKCYDAMYKVSVSNKGLTSLEQHGLSSNVGTLDTF